MENTTTGLLTPKQQKFCDEYLIDMNATRAALRAGYSASTALSGALMRIPKIAYYLQQHRETASREAQINHQMVLAELGKIAFSNMANYYHSDGTLKGVHELTADEAAALWCMKVTDSENGQSTFIRLNNKLSALEKIARHLGFYQVEAEEPEKEYVIVDKNVLTDDDRFDDDSFDEDAEEEEDEYDEFEEETEADRHARMRRERINLCHFYPKLNEVLPSGRYLTDDIIKQALREFAPQRRDEPRCITLLRGSEEEVWSTEPGVVSRGLGGGGSAVEEVVVDEGAVLKGGVIDFGSGKKGTCEVPFMMGNSREYRSW